MTLYKIRDGFSFDYARDCMPWFQPLEAGQTYTDGVYRIEEYGDKHYAFRIKKELIDPEDGQLKSRTAKIEINEQTQTMTATSGEEWAVEALAGWADCYGWDKVSKRSKSRG